MKKHAVETSVGVFVLIGLICVAYLTVQLGKMELLGDDYYRVTAKFGSISGLKEGAVVDVAGVQVGKVDRISLGEDQQAVVVMKIGNDVELDEDSFASIKTSGLIGDRYVRIEPGGSGSPLEDGGTIENTQSAVDIEEILGKYAFGKIEPSDKGNEL